MKTIVKLALLNLYFICVPIISCAQYFNASNNSYSHYFIDRDGTMYTWGGVTINAADSIGHGSSPNPIKVVHPEGKRWKKGINGEAPEFLLDEDAKLFKLTGQFGHPTPYISFDNESLWNDMSSASDNYALVSKSGKLYYYGFIYSRVSNDTLKQVFLDTLTPMPSPADGSSWTQVTVGDFHTLARTSSDKYYCYGDNTWGQFGNGDTLIHSEPIELTHSPIEGQPKWKKVALGRYLTLALDEQGNLFYTGTYHGVPRNWLPKFSTLQLVINPKHEKWKDIQVDGNSQIIGLTENGSLFVWGYCPLGWGPFGSTRPKTTYFYEPTEVPTPDSVAYWTAIGTMRSSCYGVDDKCRVWGWGDNKEGELGATRSQLTTADTPVFIHRFCQSLSSTALNRESNKQSITDMRVYPNPASKNMIGEFTLTNNEVINIELLDILGRKVQTFTRSRYEKGKHFVTLNVSGVVSGKYILRIQADQQILSASIIVE